MASVWRGFLCFSLVSVPVKLYSAARSVSETIKLNQLHAPCTAVSSTANRARSMAK